MTLMNAFLSLMLLDMVTTIEQKIEGIPPRDIDIDIIDIKGDDIRKNEEKYNKYIREELPADCFDDNLDYKYLEESIKSAKSIDVITIMTDEENTIR